MTAAQPSKLTLKATDIKINLTHLQRKETLIKRFNTDKDSISESVEKKKEETKFQAPKVPEIKPILTEDLNTDSDYVNALFQLIKEKGSSLSLKLCTEFIDEMKSTLDRPIMLGDLKVAADLFIKQENIEE